MGPNSRVLLAEHVVTPPLRTPVPSSSTSSSTSSSSSEQVLQAPEPLLANYGRGATFTLQDDLLMLALFNAVERTPAGYRAVVEGAGLRLVRIWPCRSPVSIIECRLPG
ncbi:hypothetical protein F5X96DRAFT_648533 [Biscogniauxia mediterranea]|nr:hypothetical protein F5X96DRAFT_648533 [Biscogniauxia mediterranea]